jgi:MYXO-CTERM domain-containing protein
MKQPISKYALFALGLALGACNFGSGPSEEGASQRQPVWSNGDMETAGTPPPGWTVTPRLNPGVNIQDPQTFAGLNLQNGGLAATSTVTGAPESQADPDAPEVLFPRYGNGAGRVNFKPNPNGVLGNNQNVNILEQTMTVGPGDIDPVDGKIHARFTVAPILENPGHAPNQQPYYFILMTNQTNGNAVLTQDYEAANQVGVPWRTSSGGALFTSWQLVDLDPGSVLAIGDTVNVRVIASGCSLGGHYGRVYVDSFGNRPPGTFIQGRVNKFVNAGSDLTYDLTYENGGSTPATSTVITFTTPNNTTFKAVNGLNGCTTPAIGQAGNVVCPIGTMAPNTQGKFSITVNVNANTVVGTRIIQGNYKIKSDGLTELLGTHLRTDVTSGVNYADIRTTVSSGLASTNWGDAITTAKVVVENFGVVAAPVVNVTSTFAGSNPLPPVTGVTWTCVGANGGVCGAANGNGVLGTTANLPVGGSVTYTMSMTVVNGSGTGKLVNTATATPGGGVSDPAPFDNIGSETLPIGAQQTLTLTKNNVGTVTSFPAAIACGANCTTASAKFANGSTVVLHADPPPGGQFLGWGGACSGTAFDCTVTMGNAQNVTAKFVGPPASIAVSGGGTQSTKVATAFANPLAAVVKDGGGNVVPNIWVSFGVPSAGASASLSTYGLLTDANGIAAPTALANTIAGSYTASATYPGAQSPVAFNLTNTPDAAAGIKIANASGNQSAQVGTPFASPLTVTVVDKWGNPVPGANVNFSEPGSEPNAKLSGTKVTTDANGNATINATAGNVTGTYVVTASLDGDVASVDFTLTNTGVAPLALSIVSGSPQTATVKTAFAAPLKVLVQNGNQPVQGAIVTFAAPVSGASATLSAFTATTDSTGQAQITATATAKAGVYSVVASTNGAQKPVAFALTNAPGAPAGIVVNGLSSPQSAPINSDFAEPISVTVVDADGNPVPGATVNFTVPGGGATATLSGGSVTTDANGNAKITAKANGTVGSYAVTVSTTGAPNATVSLTNTGVAPSTLAIDSGNPQSTTVGTAFAAPLVVKVLDFANKPVQGAVVSFKVPATGATAVLSALSATTNAQGLAQVTATASQKAGLYLVQVSLNGTTAQVAFQLTNLAGTATGITVASSASPQSTVVTTAFPLPLLLTVTDTFGNPVVGAKTTYAAPGAEPTAILGKTTTSTDLDGRTAVAAVAGKQAGSYDVNATVNGVGTPGVFKLTNTTGKPATIAIASGGTQSAPALTQFKDPIVAKVTDANGAPVAGVPVTVTVPSSGPSGTFVPQTVVTDVVGSAAITVTANDKLGTFVLGLSVQGAATPANANLTITGIPTQTTLDVAVATDGSSNVQLNATVTATGGQTPTGVVRFQIDGKDVGTGNLNAGKAAFTATGVAPGNHQAVAIYDVQGIFDGSSSAAKDFVVNDGLVLQGGGFGCNATGGTGGSWLALLGVAGALAAIRRKRR